MTQLHAERNLFHALDTYMDNGTSIHNMQQVAHNLNTQTGITPTIRVRFCSLLSESQNDNIRKTLDLLEYLTVFSSLKLAQIVNDDKFMEYISQALMENELLDRVLNLLKFWSDEFADSKQDIELVFVLLENLEQIDIHLPAVYDSPFKNMAAGPINPPAYENPVPPAAQGLVSSKMSELILKAKEVRDETKQLLESKDPKNALSAQNNTKINHLLAQILRVCQEFDGLKNVELNPEVRRSIENVIEELNSYRIKLHERLNLNAATAAYSQNDDDSYKIIISEVEQSKAPAAEDSTAASSKILEMDELLNYKVQPCLQAVYCKKIPEYDAEADEDDELNEIKCEGWHSSANRKRVVYDDSGLMTYSCKECDLKDNCPLSNLCKESHNFYEKMFHPHYYKKERCKNVRNCQNGRYCPYYHTMQEMDDWQKTLKQYFEGTNESNEEGIEEEDNTSTHDIQTTKSQELDSYPEDENYEPSKQSRYSKYDNPSQSSSTLTNQYKGIHNLSGFSKSRNGLLNNPGPFFSKSEPLEEPKGNLHSKLVIRKKYEDPTLLSQFFQKSQLFSGLPFFTCYPVNANKNEQAQTEVNEEAEQAEDISENLTGDYL